MSPAARWKMLLTAMAVCSLAVNTRSEEPPGVTKATAGFRLYTAEIWRGNYAYMLKDGRSVDVKNATHLLLQPVLDTGSRDQSTGQWTEATNFGACSATCDDLYRVGSTLNLYSHGALIGRATLKARSEGDTECETGMPFETTATEPWPNHVLATRANLPGHADWQTAPNAATIRLGLELAKQELAVDRAVDIKTLQAVETKVTASGPSLFLASYEWKTKGAVKRLFLIAAGEHGTLIPLSSSRHEEKDMDSGTDQEIEVFADQLDLDGDGIDEIITNIDYYESYDVTVYRQLGGKWVKVFQGGGANIC